MIGKLDPERLEAVFSRTGVPDEDVVQGPAYGEDTALLRIGNELLVVNTDPVSLATERIGTIGTHIACNDIAASGGEPRWLTAAIFLPDDSSLDAITDQLDAATHDIGVSIVGGHTEYAPERDRPLLSLTCLGLADEYVPTGGAQPGDTLVLTKGAGIEGTAILATDFREDVALPDELLERGAALFSDLSVLPEARILREYANALHDPTEGGLIDGALELAVASDAGVRIDRERVPVL